MPRYSRVVLPATPHHITQCGHNNQPIFTDDDDFEYYLSTLADFKDAYGVSVYAFCLMSNHVHLIVEPGEDISGMAQLMKRLAGRQTRHFNRKHNRRGTLWESRYRSSPIQTEPYLLACCRYVELSPVRAGLVSAPGDYKWSSYRRHAQNSALYPWLDMHNCYLALGDSESNRQQRYRAYTSSAVPATEWNFIRDAVQRSQLTGNKQFIDQVEAIVGRRIENRKQGRPRKKETGPTNRLSEHVPRQSLNARMKDVM